MKLKYPLEPKSTAYMQPGQFWPILLSDGRYACGRVLQVDQTSRRMFLAGLMDWTGHVEPNSESLAKSQILYSGHAHIKTVTSLGVGITGFRELDADGLKIPLTLDQSPGANCRLRRGYEVLRLASQEEQDRLPRFQTWGYKVISRLAERHFVSV